MKESKYSPLLWVQGDALFNELSRKEKKLFFAICSHSKRICRIEPFNISVIVINDVIIDEELKDCELSKSCLDFNCELNKTTKESFKKCFGLKGKLTDAFGKGPIKYNKKSEDELHSFDDFIEHNPDGGYVLKRLKN
jgi:hypothetical protein